MEKSQKHPYITNLQFTSWFSKKNKFICNLQKFGKSYEEMSFLLSTRGIHWCWISRWESSQSQPYCGCESFINKRCCNLLWHTSYTWPHWVDRFPISHSDWPKLVRFLRAFLHPSYGATMNDCSGVILYLMPHRLNHFLMMNHSMTYLHSLVDSLRMKNRCCQKEGEAKLLIQSYIPQITHLYHARSKASRCSYAIWGVPLDTESASLSKTSSYQ